MKQHNWIQQHTHTLCCHSAVCISATKRIARVGVCVRCLSVAMPVYANSYRRICVQVAVNRLCYELMLIWILPDAAKRYRRSANWVQFSRKRRLSHYCHIVLSPHTQSTQKFSRDERENNSFFLVWNTIVLYFLFLRLLFFWWNWRFGGFYIHITDLKEKKSDKNVY